MQRVLTEVLDVKGIVKMLAAVWANLSAMDLVLEGRKGVCKIHLQDWLLPSLFWGMLCTLCQKVSNN